MTFQELDDALIDKMRALGIPALRISVGVVFLWFGLLKIFGLSPVVDLISDAYPLFPEPLFIIGLGCWEAMIGLGLIFKVNLRLVILALWFQMAGVFGSMVSVPSVFFDGNPFLLTFEGEFLIKNLVIIAASLVVGGYEVKQDEPAAAEQPYSYTQ